MENMGFIVIIIIASVISTVLKTVRSRMAPPQQKPTAAREPAPLSVDQAAAAAAWEDQTQAKSIRQTHKAADTAKPVQDQWQQRVDEKRQQSKDDRAAEAAMPTRAAAQTGLTLNFGAQSVLNGVIMHEILTRPRAATRRMPGVPCQRTRS